MSKLKSKRSSRKKEEPAAAAAAVAEGKENVGGNDPDGDFEKPAKKTKKGKSSTKKGIDDNVEAAATAGGGNDDGDTKPSASTKQKKGKKDTKKPSSDDAGGKKEGGSKKKKSKSIDADAATAAATTSTDTKKKKKSSGKKKDAGGVAGGGKQKLSAQTLAMHKKWQDAATDMGGGKIVINKTEAKKVIFDMLHDAFCPMNITQIHSSLKGVIPSPVLKTCLEEMIVDTARGDDGSDDEDDKPKKGKKKKAGGGGGAGDGGSGAAGATSASALASGYVDSLRLKSGRNANNVLYFTNHDKSANGGNGLPPDERNELVAAEQKSNQDLQSKRNELTAIQRETKQLLSEPTNEEAKERQNREEKILADLQASVEESRQYAGNEKKREQTKKRIRNLADIWWKRRRQCTDFLQGMEDATEGTISVKKCLAGDGQIDIDSDEAIINAEREMYEMRKAKKAKTKTHSTSGGVPPSTNFIGVQFSSTSKVERVYV